MPRRIHRRRPPVPAWIAAALLLAAVASVVVAAVVRDVWLLRGAVALSTLVVVADTLLLRHAVRLLRRSHVDLAGANGARAAAETRASVAGTTAHRERQRRENEAAGHAEHLGVLQARLSHLASASMYVESVLAEINRDGTPGPIPSPTVTVAVTVAAVENAPAPAVVESAADAETPPDPAQAVIWPTVDDAPTVVDLLSWDQVRKLMGETDDDAGGTSDIKVTRSTGDTAAGATAATDTDAADDETADDEAAAELERDLAGEPAADVAASGDAWRSRRTRARRPA